MNPFQQLGNNQTARVAPGVASASITLPVGTTQCIFYNNNASAAPVPCYVEFNQAATVPVLGGATGSEIVAPGAYLTLSCNPGTTVNPTTVHFITESGTAELHVTPGKGA